MSFKYRLPTRTQLSEKKLQIMLANIRRSIMDTPDEGIRGVMANAYTAIKDFVTTLGQPVFVFDAFMGDDEISVDRYNETRRVISEDLDNARSEVQALTKSSSEVFNTTSILANDLKTRAGVAASRAQDLAILNDREEPDVMVAGDSFTDTSNVNLSRPLDAAQAFINTQQGVVTLARDSSESVISEDAEIVVTPLKPDDVTDQPTSENLRRFYEGKFYGLAGTAEPEGGKWHLEEMPEKQAEGSYRYIWIEESGKRKTNVMIEEGQQIAAFEVDKDGELKNDIIIRDRGATEVEKKEVRKRMIDGNPDTYWRCEYVFRPTDFNPLVSLKDLRANPELDASEFPIPNSSDYWDRLGSKSFSKEFKKYYGKNKEDLLEDSAAPNVYSNAEEITPEDLRSHAIEYDRHDLEVEIVITLREPKSINWLNMNPMSFGETTWMKITGLDTAPTRNGEWSEIPGFSTNQFANILTDDANAELDQNTQDYTLSPSRFSYRGQGVWTFPARQVQKIRFHVLQTTPIPDLYQRIHVQMFREELTSYRHNYSSSNSGSAHSYWDHSRQYARVIKLQYLQTLMTYLGSNPVSYAGETDAEANADQSSRSWEGDQNFLSTTAGTILTGGLGSLFGSGSTTRSSSTNMTDEDTGWHATRYWIETYYDLLSYQIGIRDISAFANLYAEKSEFVSTKYISPKPLEKVSLEVDHVLPSGSSTDIRYYISINNGEVWHQINPLDTYSRYDAAGQPVPRIITFNLPGDPPVENKYITTENPVHTVMLKVTMESSDPNVTPVLKNYRLLMYPKSGLRAIDEIV